MKLSYSALVIAALGLECAVAQPAHHKHHHLHRRAYYDLKARDVDNPYKDVNFNDPNLYKDVNFNDPNLYKNNKDPAASGGSTTSSSGLTTSSGGEDRPAPTPTPTSTPKLSSSSSPSPSPSPSPSSSNGSSCPGFGSITSPIDNGNKDEYIGNVGSPYGSNMKIVSESDNCKCKYSLKLVNNGGASTEVIVWNKSGKDGKPQSGMSSEPNLNIPLDVGESGMVCFDENSQIAFSRNCERSSISNQPDCTWGEADFGNLQNGGWNGYDVSSIANSAGNTENIIITCAKGETSSQEKNSFTSASQTNAGGSVPPGSMAIQAEWR